MKRSLTLPVAAVCAAVFLPIHQSLAAERGWYAGAAFTKVSADYATPLPVLQSPALQGVDTPSRIVGASADSIGSHGFKLVAGYRLLDWLAVEADYLGLDGTGSAVRYPCIPQYCVVENSHDSSALAFSGLALWPLGRFDLFARVGVARWRFDTKSVSDNGTVLSSAGTRGTNETLGGGVQLHARRITTRLEYERRRFAGDVANTWSLGFAYGFR